MKNCITRVLCLLLPAVALLINKVQAQALNAQSDLYYILQGSCNRYLNVATNDLDTGSFSVRPIVFPLHGLTDSAGGAYLTYCANPGYTGADRITYEITAQLRKDTATAYINVLPFNNYIFPGDADQNGRVEHFDILSVGLVYGLTGPARIDSASVAALAWQPAPYLNTNPGAADCDGNGIINGGDLLTIDDNYRDSFELAPAKYEVDTSACTGNGIPFYMDIVSGDSLHDGDTLVVDIKLGDNGSIYEVYGIAFTLEFDTGFIPGIAAAFSADSSWLFSTGQGINFHRSFQNTGEMEIAICKTDHQAAAGGGTIAQLRMPIDDNIDGIIHGPGWHPLNLKLRKPRVISEYNIVRNVCISQPDVKVYKVETGIADNKKALVRVYPNPSNNNLFVEAENTEQVEVCDITGKRVYLLNRKHSGITIISTAGMQPGLYTVHVKTRDTVSTSKIIVQH